MRVVDLLITESEMLLESYRDFSRIWEDYVSAMVFHVERGGNGLITSHDNYRDWNVWSGDVQSSRGYRELGEELRQYLYQDELVDFVKATGMRIRPEHLAPY